MFSPCMFVLLVARAYLFMLMYTIIHLFMFFFVHLFSAALSRTSCVIKSSVDLCIYVFIIALTDSSGQPNVDWPMHAVLVLHLCIILPV